MYVCVCWGGVFNRRVCLFYLLLGRVEVFRPGLKEHPDLLALRDVDRQLNEGLQAQDQRGTLVPNTPT